MTTDWKPNGIDILNINDGNIENFDFSLIDENGDWDEFDEVSKNDDTLFLDIVRVPYSKDRYRTIIWDCDKVKAKMDYQYKPSSTKNNNITYLFKYDLNPKIIILEVEIK